MASGSLFFVVSLILVITPPIATEETIRYDFVEEKPIGTPIVNLKNHPDIRNMFQNDEAVIQQVFFTFLNQQTEGKIEEYFSLEQWTGNLQFARVLDRDVPTICKQMEHCLVKVDILVNPPKYFDIIHVEINLLDQNDNAPKFPEDRIEATITESFSPGIIFPVVAASDPDSPANGIRTYRLAATDKFRLEQEWHSDGTVDLKLMLTSLLDREKVPEYHLALVAIDGGTPPKSGSVDIELFISDENDNIPAFDQLIYRRSILENDGPFEPIVTVHAGDKDSGENGRVTYSFSRKSSSQYGHMFTIGSETGEIRLTRALDYEDTDFVSLTVVAQDQGSSPKPVYCTVEITVVDINDNVPTITLQTQTDNSDVVTITEHSDVETFVVHASVKDDDSGDAGKVDCELNDVKHFRLRKQIDKEYTILTASDLDREVASQYGLILECWDHGNPSKSTTVTIQVLIDDINDHTPVFSQSEYRVTIDENNALHASIVQVQARDDDAGRNGDISYMLEEDAGDLFHINPSTGLITAMVSLDHEVVAFRQFHVLALDSAAKSRHARAVISLTITDLDDEPPEFIQKKYIFTVPENLPGRTEVGRVEAVDKDGAPFNNFTYYLDGSKHDLQLFQIDRTTGVIFTTAPLDREVWEIYRMIVFAQSDSKPPKSDNADIEIYVGDKNDNEPEIVFPKYGNETVYIHSGVPIGYTVATVQAKDPDTGDNAELTYIISKGSESGEFQIDSGTGEIKVQESLAQYDSAYFRLTIMVEDGGIPKKISVTSLDIRVTKTPVTNSHVTVPRNDSMTADKSLEAVDRAASARLRIIIIGVVVGCVVVSVVLVVSIVVIVMMKKKQRKPQNKTTALHYWTENGVSKEKENGNGPVVSPGGNTISMGDISLTVKSDVMKQPQLQLGKDDSDSGCADISHTESQGSAEDPDGSLQKHGSGGSTNNYTRTPPRRMDSFSNWLHAESFHLNQKGNVYRVSENRPAGSPGGLANNAKKTVRFSEPKRPNVDPDSLIEDPILPPPPPELSQPGVYYGPQQGYYGNHMDNGGVTSYDEEGMIVIVPEKSAFSTFQSNDGSLV